MSIEELIELQEQGSRARVLGLKTKDNPYLDPDRMPLHDGGDLADWLARHDAWRFGWETEDASRESRHYETLPDNSGVVHSEGYVTQRPLLLAFYPR
ncbi:CrpP-related protein [Rhizobium sullae]|uniref:CrpP-related protein n=1 Tax=Rhizobium sullae TaxID=50338 RepID=UPI001FCCC65A|nr:CrpP-related protein [Rhizobium sullae]